MSGDTFGTTLIILGMLMGLAFVVGAIISLFWVYKDAEQRGKTGCLWLLIAWFTWPWGVIAYYLLRERRVVL